MPRASGTKGYLQLTAKSLKIELHQGDVGGYTDLSAFGTNYRASIPFRDDSVQFDDGGQGPIACSLHALALNHHDQIIFFFLP